MIDQRVTISEKSRIVVSISSEMEYEKSLVVKSAENVDLIYSAHALMREMKRQNSTLTHILVFCRVKKSMMEILKKVSCEYDIDVSIDALPSYSKDIPVKIDEFNRADKSILCVSDRNIFGYDYKKVNGVLFTYVPKQELIANIIWKCLRYTHYSNPTIIIPILNSSGDIGRKERITIDDVLTSITEIMPNAKREIVFEKLVF